MTSGVTFFPVYCAALSTICETWFELKQLYSLGPMLSASQTLRKSEIVLYLKPAYMPTHWNPHLKYSHSLTIKPTPTLPPSPVSVERLKLIWPLKLVVLLLLFLLLLLLKLAGVKLSRLTALKRKSKQQRYKHVFEMAQTFHITVFLL